MSQKKVYQEKKLACSDCNAPFVIPVREQIFLETLGYRSPKRCGPCRRKGKSGKKSEPVGMSVREMFDSGQFQKLFEAPNGAAPEPEAPAAPPPVDETPTTSPNVAELKQFFGVVGLNPLQTPATLEEIKVLMTRANQMRWPDDRAHVRCRVQNCSGNGHIHEHFKTADAKSLIRNLWKVESSKDLRKPQIDWLYIEFGKVLSGRAFLDRDGQNTVYIATPDGATEEEVSRKVLSYEK